MTGSFNFGRVVVEEPGDVVGSHRRWWVRCACGTRKQIRGSSLVSGDTTSCGCAHRDGLRERSTKHGHRARSHGHHGNSPTYLSWRAMIQRCEQVKHQRYKDYGGRGIKVCERWRDAGTGFESFLADLGERPAGKTLDRIDPDGNYEPGNCRWATAEQQEANKRVRVEA